jgi:hypothetical protein
MNAFRELNMVRPVSRVTMKVKPLAEMTNPCAGEMALFPTTQQATGSDC